MRSADGRSLLCVIQDARLHPMIHKGFDAWRVTIVSSAFDALRLVNRDEVFDEYVIGYWLPDLTGLRLCRDIRKTDPHVPDCRGRR